jgi:hypothetical protein
MKNSIANGDGNWMKKKINFEVPFSCADAHLFYYNFMTLNDRKSHLCWQFWAIISHKSQKRDENSFGKPRKKKKFSKANDKVHFNNSTALASQIFSK